jgi:hypothetical protein
VYIVGVPKITSWLLVCAAGLTPVLPSALASKNFLGLAGNL